MTQEKLFPAYLWTGPEKDLISYTQKFLKNIFCKNKIDNSCTNACVTCNQIEKKQFYNMLWLKPENSYTVSSIEIIFETIKFKLDDNQHFFFILEQADLLNLTTANSLLKSLEEPPTNYHFILLTSYEDGILPTIASRCVLTNLNTNNLSEFNLLLRYFTDSKITQLQEAIKELDKTKIHEKDIISFLDQIFSNLTNKFIDSLNNSDLNYQNIITRKIDIINQFRSKLPMPGSSKIFLRNLLFQFLSL